MFLMCVLKFHVAANLEYLEAWGLVVSVVSGRFIHPIY